MVLIDLIKFDDVGVVKRHANLYLIEDHCRIFEC